MAQQIQEINNEKQKIDKENVELRNEVKRMSTMLQSINTENVTEIIQDNDSSSVVEIINSDNSSSIYILEVGGPMFYKSETNFILFE